MALNILNMDKKLISYSLNSFIKLRAPLQAFVENHQFHLIISCFREKKPIMCSLYLGAHYLHRLLIYVDFSSKIFGDVKKSIVQTWPKPCNLPTNGMTTSWPTLALDASPPLPSIHQDSNIIVTSSMQHTKF